MEKKKIKIGTRGSQLALRQAGHIKKLLESAFPETAPEIITVSTQGDAGRQMETAGAATTGLFTSGLETALISSDIDIAVHSLKDLPVRNCDELHLAAVPERENPADVLVSKDGLKLTDLPAAARILTGSPRRRALVREQRPDLRVENVRGNVPTRIRTMHSQNADALILAYAGLKRLGLERRISEIFPLDTFTPAPGQGALAVQIRAEDDLMRDLCAALDHRPSRLCVTAERAFFHATGAGCHAAAGAWGALNGDKMTLVGMFSDHKNQIVRKKVVQEVRDRHEAAKTGQLLAETFRTET